MLEIEVKYPAPSDGSELVAKLKSWGAVAEPPREDTDSYFNAPDRDFAITDEVFRLRRIGSENFFTYKGPKRDTATKTRTEYELPIAAGPEAAATAVKMVTSLGYSPVAIVTKSRSVYHVQRDGFELSICLDDVGAVGKFVELEIVSEEAQLEKARNIVLTAAAELGLTSQERRSYLEMLLAQPRG